MNKWKQRDNKRDKKRVKSFPLREQKDKDKSTNREIKQARRDKEAVWDNLDTEGDDE